jgi:hypothetical protein
MDGNHDRAANMFPIGLYPALAGLDYYIAWLTQGCALAIILRPYRAFN